MQKPCKFCGKAYNVTRKHKKYCSDECRKLGKNLTDLINSQKVPIHIRKERLRKSYLKHRDKRLVYQKGIYLEHRDSSTRNNKERRLEYFALFDQGLTQVEVARQLGVTNPSAHKMYQKWKNNTK